MAVSTFTHRGGPITMPPAARPPALSDLVPPSAAQIAVTKQHIVGLGRYLRYLARMDPSQVAPMHKKFIQHHIDMLETNLSQLDPRKVAGVAVSGYPLNLRKGTPHG